MLHPFSLPMGIAYVQTAICTPRAGVQQKALLQYQSTTSQTKDHLESGYWQNFSSISDEKYEKILLYL
jgi:hypothetical protein